MKKLVVMGALLLGGCASVQDFSKQHFHQRPQVKVVAPAPAPAPVVTPNAQVKSRWYNHFPKHPKFFHH